MSDFYVYYSDADDNPGREGLFDFQKAQESADQLKQQGFLHVEILSKEEADALGAEQGEDD